MPSYYGSNKVKKIPKNERIDGLQIRRLALLPEYNRLFFVRAINSICFGLCIFFHLIFKGKNYDVIQVATTPPIIPALAVTLAAKYRKIRVVYHCQDIYPDITKISQSGDKHNFFYTLLHRLDSYIMNNTWRIIVLSEDMKRHIVDTRRIGGAKVKSINNFDFNRNDNSKDESFSPFLDAIIRRDNKKIIYAGNLGYFQNLDLIFEVINSIIEHDEFTFIVVGEGVRKKELQEKYTNKNIVYTGFLPNNIIQKLYNYCHIGLAPVVPGIEKVAYPSKVISYTLNGLPVLTFSSKGSTIEQFIEKNKLGINYAFEGKPLLRNKIKAGLSMDFDRASIKRIAFEEFCEQKAFEKWREVYQEL
jgi:glycosyltransferase involved in cell wall biosynthesis